nr:DUF262 domain-containing protein [Kineosporia rhizophila]
MQLFEGEEVDLRSGNDAETTIPDELINEKYISGDVRIITEQARYPLSTITSLIASGDYELNPEFQRRHRWSPEKQSRLIESFIMNVPVPPIFLYEDEFSHYEVMDGLQRLTAILSFYRNELELTGLTEWRELEGRTYSRIPEQVKKGIDRRYLSSIILLRETAKSAGEAERLKQMVFERINSGGEALREQETRNAIYNGRLNKLCIELSRDRNLCRMWGIPEPTPEELYDPTNWLNGAEAKELELNRYYKTMFDVELVLRFFAHRQRRRIGGGALSTYLDAYLKQGNMFSQETLESLRHLFVQTTELLYDVLGERAFWLWRYRHNHWDWLERPTTTAYDAFMFVFSQNLDRAHKMRELAPQFQESVKEFYQTHVDSFDARMTNMSNLRERDRLAADFVNSVLENGRYVPADAT